MAAPAAEFPKDAQTGAQPAPASTLPHFAGCYADCKCKCQKPMCGCQDFRPLNRVGNAWQPKAAS